MQSAQTQLPSPSSLVITEIVKTEKKKKNKPENKRSFECIAVSIILYVQDINPNQKISVGFIFYNLLT